MLPIQRGLNSMGQWRTTVKRGKGPNAYYFDAASAY